MSNSNWADEAFGPLDRGAETRADKVRAELHELFAADFSVLELVDELELTDGCETCFEWVFGVGPECEQHRAELAAIREHLD